MRKGTHYLMDRNYEIIDFVHRYKVATDDMLAEKFFGLERRNANVLRVTRKLVERNYLKRVKLCGSESYLVPTRKACRVLEENERTPKPLTEHSLPASLAIAYYCLRNGVQRFRGSEYARFFPLMHKPGLDGSRYYSRVEDYAFEEYDQDATDCGRLSSSITRSRMNPESEVFYGNGLQAQARQGETPSLLAHRF